LYKFIKRYEKGYILSSDTLRKDDDFMDSLKKGFSTKLFIPSMTFDSLKHILIIPSVLEPSFIKMV
jgi:hypothetical protein